jgi:regulatory protein
VISARNGDETAEHPSPIDEAVGWQVTAITASARHQGRFEVVVDGASIATLSLDAIERLRLHTGTTWTSAIASAAAAEEAALHTFDRAANMLAARPRAARDLERQLVRKGEPPEYVASAIARLTALGAIDDARFARQFIRSKLSGAGLSRRRLQSELWRRGVAREVIDAAIAEVMVEDEVDEGAQIAEVAAKKMRTLRSLDSVTARRRLYAFLARRGYDASAIRRLMDTLPGGDSSID